MGTDITDGEGKYRLKIDTELFKKLENLGYNKVVVYVAPGISGFKVINLIDGTTTVDLITGAPAPSAAK